MPLLINGHSSYTTQHCVSEGRITRRGCCPIWHILFFVRNKINVLTRNRLTDTFAKNKLILPIVTFEQAQEKTLQYAKENGYSTIRKAGERDGFWYFHFFNKYPHRMFLGLPHYVKVSQTSNDLVYVEDFHETMWATEQEAKLNNL